MARKSKIEKELKIQRTIAKYRDKRAQLIAAKDYVGLSMLPRNASPTRSHNRCEVTGRPRAYLRKYKVSRIAFRYLAHSGQIPGVKKASW